MKLDRARIQIGRISNFGLLEMTRQRLKESSVKWEVNLSLESFAQKIIKKIEMLAFEDALDNNDSGLTPLDAQNSALNDA